MSVEPPRHATFDSDPEMAEDAAILAAVDGGAFATHGSVRQWLLSKDTPEPLPRPQPGD